MTLTIMLSLVMALIVGPGNCPLMRIPCNINPNKIIIVRAHNFLYSK